MHIEANMIYVVSVFDILHNARKTCTKLASRAVAVLALSAFAAVSSLPTAPDGHIR